MNKTEWINRFPICALVYKVAAEKMGYRTDEAKSLGNARAIFFARAKFGGYGYKPKKPGTSKVESIQKMQKDYAIQREDIVLFAGLETHIARMPDDSIRAVFGGKIIEPEDYDKAVENKIVMFGGERALRKLEETIERELDAINKYELNTSVIYKIYEKIRDDVRKVEFLS